MFSQLFSRFVAAQRVLITLSICFWSAWPISTPAQSDAPTLVLGTTLSRTLEAGQTHTYSLVLAAGQVTRIIVEHHGQDIVVNLYDPAGQPLAEFDLEFRKDGQEVVTHVAETAGRYRVEIKPKLKNAQPGHYTIVQAELRTANEQDRTLQEARDLSATGDKALREGRYSDALQPFERALQLYQNLYGAEHIEIARLLRRLGQYYWLKGGLIEKSLESHQRALAMREKLLGPEHPETADSLIYLSIPWYEKTDYQQAERLLLRSIKILEQTVGTAHPTVAYALLRLATNYNAKGELDMAEKVAVRALRVWEESLGAVRELGSTLHLLAMIAADKSDYDKAERYYQKANEVREKILPPNHPSLGIGYNNLCGIYVQKGEYEKARQTCQQAVEIFERGQGPMFIHVGTSLSNIGNIYRHTGEYEKAAAAYKRVLEIIEKNSGPATLLMGTHLIGLAEIYVEEGAFAKAAPLYQRVREIYEKVLDPAHPDHAIPLFGLGIVYREQGELLKADQTLRRVLEIREKTLGPDHDYVARTLNELAILRNIQGDYADGEQLSRRAVAIGEKALGTTQPLVATYLKSLSILYEAQGMADKAVATQMKATAISEHNIGSNLVFGSERQKRSYLETMASEVDRTISLHLRTAQPSAAARDLALSLVLQRKGRLLETTTDDLALLRGHLTAQEQALLDRLQTVRTQLARLVLNEAPKDNLDQYRAQVREREAEIETAEAEISRRSAKYRAQTQPVTLAAVQAAIPPDAALVEFVVWRPFDARAARTEQAWGTPRYAAYVLRSQSETQWVELGEAAQLERAIAAWRQALRNPGSANVKTLARIVDQKIMQPVRALLGEAKHLLVAPDGALNLIPFAALVDEHQRFLLERYSFSYLTSGRELLRLGVPRESHNPPLIIANPDFGSVAMTAAKPGSGARVDLSQVYFQPLPGTAGEARALLQLFPQATVLSRAQATETALKQIAAPSILHVATHGFFLPGDDSPTRSAGLRPGNVTNRAAAWRLSRLAVKVQNPLLRSGLVLAGANQSQSEGDDGILTALESASLNLWGTKLVVLSACDTGVGEVRNGDGVYGLRRALTQAGAETQVMSLWPVADTDTRDLMVGYYQGLQAGQGRGAALRQVQLRLLKSRLLRHPHYWASFIQSGEWANLDGKR